MTIMHVNVRSIDRATRPLHSAFTIRVVSAKKSFPHVSEGLPHFTKTQYPVCIYWSSLYEASTEHGER